MHIYILYKHFSEAILKYTSLIRKMQTNAEKIYKDAVLKAKRYDACRFHYCALCVFLCFGRLKAVRKIRQFLPHLSHISIARIITVKRFHYLLFCITLFNYRIIIVLVLVVC